MFGLLSGANQTVSGAYQIVTRKTFLKKKKKQKVTGTHQIVSGAHQKVTLKNNQKVTGTHQIVT